MKKLSFLLLGAAGLMLASCSNEEFVPSVAEDDGNVTVTISLPNELGTRTLGDGLTAKYLYYSVFNNSTSSQAYVFGGYTEFPEGELSTTVSFGLANGKQYNIVFFATAEKPGSANAVYTFNYNTSEIKANYENMTSAPNLADMYDCFQGMVSTGVVGTANRNISCTLNRPVAQVNWGTSDQDLASVMDEDAFGPNGQYIVTYLTTKAYNTFNILQGNVTGNPVEVELSQFTAPVADGDVFPITGYDYIAMNYFLAPTTESYVYDLDLSITNEGNPATEDIKTIVAVTNAPVQANYQTNIYGNLLSSDVTVAVTKDPIWKTPSNDVEY